MRKIILLLAILVAPSLAHGASTINTTNAYAWGANIGWTNWRPSATDGVVIGEFVCSGYIWGANVGWINVGSGSPANGIQYQDNSATDFGLNYGVDSSQPNVAILRGLAYGANIGWINFEATGNPRINLMTGQFDGYAYSANCGWINLGEPGAHNLVTDHVANGVDTDSDGMADAFELLYFGNLSHNASTDTDGDGVSDLNEYLQGTNPNLRNDRLQITTYLQAPNPPSSQNSQITWNSTTGRLYIIETNPGLNPLNWVDSGLGTFAPLSGTSTTRTVTLPTASKRFFRVKSVRPLP